MSKWFRQHIRFWVRTFWGTFLISVIALAVCVQLGRAVFPIMNEYRDVVEKNISSQLGVNVSIGKIQGEWHGLRPKIALENLAVHNKESDDIIFVIASVEAEVSLVSSLRDWRLAFRQLFFTGLQASVLQEQNGSWRIRGMTPSNEEPNVEQQPGPPAEPEVAGTPIIDDPLDIFLFGRRVTLQDTELVIDLRNDLQANITIPTIRLENDADFHRLSAEFQFDSGDQALSLVVEGVGDPRDENDFNSKGYLRMDHFPSEKVIAALGIPSDVLIKDPARRAQDEWGEHGRVSLNLWFSGTTQKGLTWSGDIAMQGLPLEPPKDVLWPETFRSQFSGRWQSRSGWRVAFANNEIHWPEFSAPPVNFVLHGKLGSPTELQLDRLKLEEWHGLLDQAGWIPEPIKGAFDELKPYGALSHVQLQSRSEEDGWFFLRAEVTDGGVQDYMGVPAIQGVNGLVEATALDGHVLLDSRNGFVLNFPRVYHHPLEFSEARGDVAWEVNVAERRVGLSSGQLFVARPDVAARGHFNLRLPFQSDELHEPEMTLVIGVEKGFADLHRMLVPYTVPESLYEWMGRSIKGGSLSDGAFIYHGTLMSESKRARVLQLSASARDANIEFDPQWPAIKNASGRILLDDERFSVTGLQGQMRSVNISNANLSLRRLNVPQPEEDKETSPALHIAGDIAGESGATIQLLKESPIRDLLGEELASWQIDGSLLGHVDILVPLVSGQAQYAQQDIRLSLSKNQLHIPRLDLTFNDVQGGLHYTHDQGVTIKKMKGTLWQQPMEVSVHTEHAQQSEAAVQVDFKGAAAIKDLHKWTGRPELQFMDGKAKLSGQLSVPVRSDNPLILEAFSTLKGVAIDLPAPIGKTARELATFRFGMRQIPNKGQVYEFDLKRDVALKARVALQGNELQGITVVVGEDEPVVQENVINIQAEFADGDALEWYDAVDRYIALLSAPEVADIAEQTGQNSAPAGKNAPSNQPPPRVKGRLHWDALNTDSITFKDFTLGVTEETDRWMFDIASPDAEGLVTLWNDNRPLDIDLALLHLNPIERQLDEGADAFNSAHDTASVDELQNVAAESGLASIDLASLPPAKVSVDQWWVGPRDMGQVTFDLRPVSGGVAAVNLFANIDHLDVRGRDQGSSGAEMLWLRSETGDICYFSGMATTTDVADVLDAWDVGRAMTSKRGVFDIQIQWPGAPDAIALESISGLIDMQMERGRFIRGAEVGENPLVKLVGLLNFDTLVRRLRLDFSDLHPEGLAYESVQGNLLFKEGIIEIDEPIQVDMPVSQLQLVGRLDIHQQRIDARLVATLPVAGNLTFAAALTGGLPMAIGVFVVGKLFKPQMDRVSSLRYRIRGSWDDPNVELEKIFDNKTVLPSVTPQAVAGEQQAPSNPSIGG